MEKLQECLEKLRGARDADWAARQVEIQAYDPLLSVSYGQEYERTGSAQALERQLEHLNRAIGQLDEQGRCPEMYFLRQGKWTPNEHTPLAWTQANLSLAWRALEWSAGRG